MAWNDSIKYTMKSGCMVITNTSKPLHNGTIKYSDYLENRNLDISICCIGNAAWTLGVNDSFAALVIAMNQKSRASNETWFIISLSRRQLNDWFIKYGSQEYSAKKTPLDSPLREVFYVTSRRNKIKKFPLGEHEVAGVEKLSLPKMILCRFPIKYIFLGVVARSIPHRNFDGKTWTWASQWT